EIAISTAQDFILSKVPKKEIIDIDITVELSYNNELDVDISVNIIFDELSSVDPKIADEAVDHAIKEIDKIL
ncbi:MAG: DUF3194 domain-containing protein, partial [Methanobacterium sp.]